MDQDARPIDKGLYDGVVDTTGGKIYQGSFSYKAKWCSRSVLDLPVVINLRLQ